MPDRRLCSSSTHSQPHTPVRSVSTSSKWSFQPSSSPSSDGSNTFWRTPPNSWNPFFHAHRPPPVSTERAGHSRILYIYQQQVLQYLLDLKNITKSCYRSIFRRRHVLLLILAIFTIILLLCLTKGHNQDPTDLLFVDTYEPILPVVVPSAKKRPDPVRWLKEYSNNKYSVSTSMLPHLPMLGSRRPKAALISLVRNSELAGMMQSMRQLEMRWNRKYQYPWIFFNDEPFTEEFKRGTQNSTSVKCYYAVVPREHWSLPEWIDESRFLNSLEYLGSIGVGKGWMVSYHHMCRWNSGFFYKHPILRDYDWYWRIEPDVHYFCDIDYDVFRFMRDNKLKYGFNMNILDDARSFPSLWARTRAFAAAHPNLIHPEADLTWLLDSQTGGEYNNCQFFSNFEIGSLNFWRDQPNEAYFNWLDKAGGFYYERYGDAPVHTLSVAMFLPKDEVWFFGDIGYQHNINHHCPPKREAKCACEPTSMDENFYKLVPLESPQRKPLDTCIRQFLGGKWLEKKEGWTMEGEKAYGGDGYNGYVLLGGE